MEFRNCSLEGWSEARSTSGDVGAHIPQATLDRCPSVLAIAILALLTILPEYAIEAILAWDAGASFDPVTRAITPETQRVAANVTGANRLLIGVGWSVVILIYWFKHRDILDLRGKLGPEVTFLAAATLRTFAIFFLKGIHVLLAAVLVGVYLAYLWAGSNQGGRGTGTGGHRPVAGLAAVTT